MSLISAVIQYAPTEDKAENLATIEKLLRQAKSQRVRLAILPEYAIYTVPKMDDRFVDNAESLDGPSLTQLIKLSQELGIAVVAGINETAGDGRIHNTLVAMDQGEIQAVYRKVHLYDAFGYRESDRVNAAAPNNGSLFEIDGYTVGMHTCYDLRFPETTRSLVDQGANVVALPAEWIPGPLKEYHWNTLIRARAIENTIYVWAADQCAPTGSGHSAIIDPMGIALSALGEAEGVGVAELTAERLSNVRAVNPALELRRFKVSAME